MLLKYTIENLNYLFTRIHGKLSVNLLRNKELSNHKDTPLLSTYKHFPY